MNNFWKKLPKPFFVLAPMADVTDAAFRRIITKYGKPDVMWTEFVSADGLAHPLAREKLKIDLAYTEAERPIVAQLFSSNPENMFAAAKFCAELGFDGIDINMGCPDKSIEKQGAGAAMIKNPEAARAVIRAAREGAQAGSAGLGLPISVKTRVGYNKVQIAEWIPMLLSEDLAALTIHARTRKEMSLVPAKWEHVREVVEIRNKMGKDTLIIGNGDVKDIADARQKAFQTGCDGIMLGRAIFGNPWLFSNSRELENAPPLALPEKFRVMIEHTKLFLELLGNVKNFAIMKKHYKAYVNGFDGAKELRVKLMEAGTIEEIEAHVQEFLSTYQSA